MLYSEDIDPMLKEIGLVIEEFMKKEPHLYIGYECVGVDDNSSTFVFDKKPLWDNIEWYPDNPLDYIGHQQVYNLGFTNKQMTWIEDNAEKCLFRLGDKSGN